MASTKQVFVSCLLMLAAVSAASIARAQFMGFHSDSQCLAYAEDMNSKCARRPADQQGECFEKVSGDRNECIQSVDQWKQAHDDRCLEACRRSGDESHTVAVDCMENCDKEYGSGSD
jgi:hypothetical protein